MAACEKFSFSSTAGPILDARLWRPEGQPRAVVQLIHGMAEHIDRYQPLSQALNKAGIAVVGHNQLGHGQKAPRKGYFADKNGWQCLIDDVHRLRGVAQEQFPGAPYFMLGHSMGSFVLRCYLEEHAGGLCGAMLSGTGHFDAKLIQAGLSAARCVCLLGGKRKPSALLNHLVFSANNKPFAPARTAFDWFSRADEAVDPYIADPLCGFVFTGGAYRDFFRGLQRLTDEQARKRIPAELPLRLFSGDHDPVGDMGQGVELVAQELREAGLQHVETRLYPDGRHEMLNEVNRDEVFRDVIIFVEQHLPGKV